MAQIHIVCHRPGMHRGGRSNPPHAAYDHGVHTLDELRELLADPQINVIVGDVLTEADIDKLEAAAEAAAAKAAAKKA